MPDAFIHERRTIIDLSTFGIPEVPLLGRYQMQKAQQGLEPHCHSGLLEICYLIEGRQVYRIGGKDYALRRGDVFLSFPGEIHSTGDEPQERGSLYWMHVRLPKETPIEGTTVFLGQGWEIIHPLVENLGSIEDRYFAGAFRIKGLFDELFQIAGSPPTPLSGLSLRIRILQLLIEIVELESEEKTHQIQDTINQVLEYIDSKIHSIRSVDELAAVMNLSLSWFKSKFKDEIGMSPWEYVMRRKVLKATELLRGGESSITRIAYSLGFSSSQYFATVYKKYTGKNPREILPDK